ncbi:MAG: hypothetical protein GXP24_08140 [Planctomycetes bacterium]|nr:hypothetical protein [Planctomycetota bacterium]
MPNRLNVPQDLDALIEKREIEERRQEQESSANKERRSGNKERRSGTDRRDEEKNSPPQ